MRVVERSQLRDAGEGDVRARSGSASPHQIGAADRGHRDADDRLTRSGLRARDFLDANLMTP
jgi:hypothetical protein